MFKPSCYRLLGARTPDTGARPSSLCLSKLCTQVISGIPHALAFTVYSCQCSIFNTSLIAVFCLRSISYFLAFTHHLRLWQTRGCEICSCDPFPGHWFQLASMNAEYVLKATTPLIVIPFSGFLRHQILLFLFLRPANNGPLPICYQSLSGCCTILQHLQSLSLTDSPHFASSTPLEKQIVAPHLPLSGCRTLCYIHVLGEVHVVSQRRWRRRVTTEIKVHLPLSLASHQARLLLLVCLSRASQAKKRVLPY